MHPGIHIQIRLYRLVGKLACLSVSYLQLISVRFGVGKTAFMAHPAKGRTLPHQTDSQSHTDLRNIPLSISPTYTLPRSSAPFLHVDLSWPPFLQEDHSVRHSKVPRKGPEWWNPTKLDRSSKRRYLGALVGPVQPCKTGFAESFRPLSC